MRSKLKLIFVLVFFSLIGTAYSQQKLTHQFPVRGLCIAAPISRNLDSFIVFINQELKPRKINTLILRIDYHYQFKLHPELTDTLALSSDEVKKIVLAA